MKSFPKLRVWAVSSITITWRLGDVEAGDDEKLVTIKENDKTTNIYFREVIREHDQHLVTRDLLRHFIGEVQHEIKDVSLLALLMNAPIDQLPDIMEQHDISPFQVNDDVGSANEDTDGEGSNEDNNDTRILNQTEDAPNSGVANFIGDDYQGERSFRGVSSASKVTHSNREAKNLSLFAPIRTNFPKPLQELIPSYPSRIKNIAQKASEFWMTDSLAAKNPSKSYGSDSVLRRSLRIRNRNIDQDSEGGSLSRWVNPPVISSGSSGDGQTPKTSKGHFVGYQAPASASVSDYSPPGTWDSPTLARDIRHKAIGFLGELYVTHLYSTIFLRLVRLTMTCRFTRCSDTKLLIGHLKTGLANCGLRLDTLASMKTRNPFQTSPIWITLDI
jgi:hypothetical protein